MGPTATVAFVFCDWVGSTERQTRLGDAAADDLRRRVLACLRSCVTDTGGTVVKSLGDGLMAVFERSTIGAIECARLMHERIAAVEPEDPVHLRIGVSAGEAAEDDGDWFGTPVVEAARLCDAAGADRTLAPALVVALVGSRCAGHRFRPIGRRQLKGFAAPLEVVEVDGPDIGDPGADPAATPRSTTPPDGPTSRRSVQPAPDTATSPGLLTRARRPSRRLVSASAAVAALVVVVAATFAVASSGDGADTGPTTGAASSELGVSAPEGYEPTFSVTDCPEPVSTDVPAAECGELTVPRSRQDPDGGSVTLPVTRVTAEDSEADPVLLLDINEPLARSSLPGAAEVVALGIRGAEDLDAVRCEEMATVWTESLAQPADDPAALERKRAVTARCVDDLRSRGVHLDGYNLEEVAMDLRDLMVSLDMERVTVASGGYATPAAVAFARAHPEAVAAMVLTNPVPPGRSVQSSPTSDLSKQFDRLTEACRDDAECVADFGDVAALYDRTWERLERSPVQVSTTALDGSGPFTVLLDGRRVAAATEATLHSSEQVGLLPAALGGASDELVAAAGIHEDVSTYIGADAPNMALLAMLCSYDAEPNRTAEIADASNARFAGANDPAFQVACRALGVPSVRDAVDDPLDLDVPVLIAVGGLAAPGVNGWGELMAGMLPRATVASFPTISSDLAFAPPPCLRELRNAFVSDPDGFDGEGVAGCEEQSPPIEFLDRG